MRVVLLRSFLAICILALALPAVADVDEQGKIEVNKIIKMIGFTPNYNASATVGETEPNDSCAGPDSADPFVDSVSGAIDVAGDEDWYAFSGTAGECITVGTESFNGSTTDTQLYLYDAANCSDTAAWLVWDDDAGPGLFSLITEFEIPATGTYYLRVKHWSSSGTGEYLLTASVVTCPAPPVIPDNNTCANAEPIACNSMVSATTENASNDLEDLPSPEVCIPFGADGPDVFYSVEVPDGHQLSAVLTPNAWDPGMWFVKDCTDRTTCVAGADTGFFNDPETVSYTNTSGGTETIYIVVDGYFSGAFGPFDLVVSCDQVVSTGDTSWGAVKAEF